MCAGIPACKGDIFGAEQYGTNNANVCDPVILKINFIT
jgi:hypothetical protein